VRSPEGEGALPGAQLEALMWHDDFCVLDSIFYSQGTATSVEMVLVVNCTIYGHHSRTTEICQ